MKGKVLFLCVFLIVMLVLGLYQIPKVKAAADWTTPSAVHSKCGEHESYPATNWIDDDTETYWVHGETCFHWIIFDMGESKTVTKIRIYQADVSGNRFGQDDGLYVYVGDNPADLGDAVWEGILDVTGWQESGAFSKSGRYVKILSKSDFKFQWGIEFDAYAEAAGGEAYTADLSQSLSTSWTVLTQWDAIADFSQSLTTSWTILTEWNAILDVTQSLTTSWTVLANLNTFVDLSQAFSTSWLVDIVHTIGANHYIVDLTQALTTSWTILTQWNGIIDLSQSLSTTWTVLIQSSFNIITSLSNTFTWIVDVVKGVGINYIVDLTLAVVTSWIVDIVHTPWTEIYATKELTLGLFGLIFILVIVALTIAIIKKD